MAARPTASGPTSGDRGGGLICIFKGRQLREREPFFRLFLYVFLFICPFSIDSAAGICYIQIKKKGASLFSS